MRDANAAADAVRADRRRGDRDHAVRAAGPAGAAVGERRRRPPPAARDRVGLAITFTIAIVALAQLVKGVGLASGAARTLAIVVLIVFGVVLLIPELAARVQAPLSRLARFGPKTRGDGFWSGVGVGGALGFVCAPCAGPILAAVTSVSASSGATARVVAVAISYAVGLSAVLLLYALGGRAVIDRIRRSARGHIVERDARRRAARDRRPDGVQPRRPLRGGARQEPEPAGVPGRPDALARELERRPEPARVAAPARRGSPRASARPRPSRCPTPTGVAIPGVKTPSLPDLGAAPEFTDTQHWFNTPGGGAADAGRPPRPRRARRLLDLHVHQLHPHAAVPQGPVRTYHRYGLDIVGVETPEFTFEQEAGNVQQAISSDGLSYPVVQDNKYGTWNAYQNQYWPAEYLIDAKGQVRHTQFGEGDYKQDEAAVRELLLRGRRAPAAAADDRPRDHAPRRSWRPPRPTSTTSAPGVRPAAAVRRPPLPRRRQPPAQPVRAQGHLEGHRPVRDAGRQPATVSGASRPPTSTWC